MRPAIRRLVLLALCPVAPLLLPPAPAAAVETQPQPATNPSAVLENAKKLYKVRQFSESAAEFERANQLSGGHCAECLLGMARAYAAAGPRDQALAATRKVLQLSPPPPAPLLAEAYNQHAALLVPVWTEEDKTPAEAYNEHAPLLVSVWTKDKTLAEAYLRKAVELDGNRALYRINLAMVLILENRPAEALDLARPLATGWDDNTARRAHSLICDARTALHAPPPTVLTPSQAARGGDPEVKRVTANRSDPEAVTRPEILIRVEPEYTKKARKHGIEGTVILESIIDEEGCVTNVKLLKSLDPGLDESATTAVRHWTFKPAMYQGKPVKVYYSLTINFQVDKTPPRKPS